MSSCCCPEKDSSSTARCPGSGAVGSAVDSDTVKALLSETALARFESGEYRFCADATCAVVYFNATGTSFETSDLRVPVWQKLPFGARPVCYCFGESEASIRLEIETHGRSTAVERVRAHIAARRCACELRNPRGACCLGDLIGAVKLVGSALSEPLSANAQGQTDAAHEHAEHR